MTGRRRGFEANARCGVRVALSMTRESSYVATGWPTGSEVQSALGATRMPPHFGKPPQVDRAVPVELRPLTIWRRPGKALRAPPEFIKDLPQAIGLGAEDAWECSIPINGEVCLCRPGEGRLRVFWSQWPASSPCSTRDRTADNA